MRLPLVLFFLAPLLEIASFVIVGQAVGVLATLALVVLSAIIGVALLRFQGAGILRKLQDETRKGVDPGRELVHGALLVIAAFLLIVPGFVGDLIGLLLFVPLIRDFAWRLLKPRIIIRSPYSNAGAKGGQSERGVVDLDEDEFTRQPNTGSPWSGPRIGKD